MSAQRLKNYTSHVQLLAVNIKVKAKNLTEAKKKIREKVAAIKPAKLLDRKNFFVDEE